MCLSTTLNTLYYATCVTAHCCITDKAVKKLKFGRIPWLKGPIAYSTLPIKGFTIGNDTGLAFQGMFGGIKTRPELVHKVLPNIPIQSHICEH
jgi:hypothetical protein